MTVWRRSAMRLEDVCELLGVESPKQGMDGSRVGHAVADGRVDDVRRYCEADVMATLNCFERLRPVVTRNTRGFQFATNIM